jgi:hypothetical protein
MNLLDEPYALLDEEGCEIPEGEIPDRALRAARELMAHDVGDGRLNLKFRIEVADQNGRVVYTLPFANALAVSAA